MSDPDVSPVEMLGKALLILFEELKKNLDPGELKKIMEEEA